MMWLAAQGKKNDAGQSQIRFRWRFILSGSRRHDAFWRRAGFSA